MVYTAGHEGRRPREESDHMLAETGQREKYLYSQRDKTMCWTHMENKICGKNLSADIKFNNEMYLCLNIYF